MEAILEAAADILVRDGYAALTTNRIAERAGVNIASLYQYFPGKDAIVAELRRRHGAAERAAARDTLAASPGEGLEVTLRKLIARGVAAHAVSPELHRVFAEQLPAQRYREIQRMDAAVFTEMRRFLERSTTGVPDLELAMWMVATTTQAVMHNGALERQEDIASGRLVDELVVLLTRYLKRRPGRSPGRRSRG
ncbi:MAG TPA: TetR/AcrR family transcriptional regulator [Vicinamibacterales bacterium]|nr:TetR/AcrR family transcriptional regulator [Vicinamibacterales bacterium]